MVLGQNLAFSQFCAKSSRSTGERARRTREGSQESRRTKERAGDIPEWSRMKYERIGFFIFNVFRIFCPIFKITIGFTKEILSKSLKK